MPRGGKRTGAGRPAGSKDPQTISKEADREALRLYLRERIQPVADSLVSRAMGVRYFVTRNKKTGKYELVTNADQVLAAINAEDENCGEFYTDKPETSAIREFLDRTVDRAKEQEIEIKLTSENELLAKLDAGRKRARGQ